MAQSKAVTAEPKVVAVERNSAVAETIADTVGPNVNADPNSVAVAPNSITVAPNSITAEPNTGADSISSVPEPMTGLANSVDNVNSETEVNSIQADTNGGAHPTMERTEQQPPQCPSCWETLRATDKFCCWCGEAQPNRVLPFMKLCLECNTFLPEKANYCYACGTDVGYSSRRKVRLPAELFKDEDSEFFPRFDA
ncbi:MAG TPA: zinc ribbon domain-containing protein [Drouetiella sp.]